MANFATAASIRLAYPSYRPTGVGAEVLAALEAAERRNTALLQAAEGVVQADDSQSLDPARIESLRTAVAEFGGAESGDVYLLFSVKHSRSVACWWGPERSSYGHDLSSAGRYSKEEATLLAGDSSDTIAIPLAALGSLLVRHQVDLGENGNRKLLMDHAVPAAEAPEELSPG